VCSSDLEAFEKARGYAYRALELNDNLAEAHTALAAVLMIYNWDWDLAEEQFKLAIQLNPNYANAHYLHSVLLQTRGRLQESVTAAGKAQVLDPLSPVIGMGVVSAYFFSEQYDKALDECHKYLEMNPNFVVAQDYLVHLHVRNGLFERLLMTREDWLTLVTEKGKLQRIWHTYTLRQERPSKLRNYSRH